MIAKIHDNKDKSVLSICDEELLGKVFEEDEFVLDLRSNFYKGEKMDEKKLLDYIKRCYVINAVGKKSVGFLISNNMLKDESVSHISDIPFVQLLIQ